MKNWIIAVILSVIAIAAWYIYQRRSPHNWRTDHYIKRNVYITMRDGKKLYTAIYIPKDKKEKHPILINRTPYSIESNEEIAVNRFIWNSLYDCYFKEGYIIVRQDVRGRYKSEGDFVHIRPYIEHKKDKEIDEASDTYDTIDWLIKNVENNNGNVGVFGISYPGFYATMAGISRHPALKAISPQAPVVDWYKGDDWHHNGALLLWHSYSFFTNFGIHQRIDTKGVPYEFADAKCYDFFLNKASLDGFNASIGDSITFWHEMYAHPNYDSFWEARNSSRLVRNISDSIASLVVGGFYDAENLYGAINLYDSIEQHAKNSNYIAMGPWYHAGWSVSKGKKLGCIDFGSATSTWYQKNVELPFFNYYLKGTGDKTPLTKASIFFSGSNEWQTYECWPPKNMTQQTFFLNSDGLISSDNSVKSPAIYRQYHSDPSSPVPYFDTANKISAEEAMVADQSFAEKRADVLVFKSGILTEDLTLAGPIIADLFTSISTTDADFIVKLIDVYPSSIPAKDSIKPGYEMLVRGEVMRGRYRNSVYNPEPFIPSKITEVKYTLQDVAHVFKKGHRLMVQIQSTWFPMVDRNPQQFINIYTAKAKDYISSDIRIYTSGTNASRLILPVLK